MYKLVTAVYGCQRSIQRPEHNYRQSEGHNKRQWNVEILSHIVRLLAKEIKSNKLLLKIRLITKLEVFDYKKVGGSDKLKM